MEKMSEELRNDFFDAYEKIKKEIGENAKYMTNKSLLEKAIHTKAKSFYITPESAIKKINYYIKNGDFGYKHKVYDDKMKKIMDLYYEIAKKTRFSKRLDIMNEVVNSEAPDFYITICYAKTIYYEKINSNKKKR